MLMLYIHVIIETEMTVSLTLTYALIILLFSHPAPGLSAQDAAVHIMILSERLSYVDT